MHPFEKYRFYVDEKNQVIAISTYAGRYVKGVAKCDPRDKFDLEKGKKLAAARCAEKIAEKRVKQANSKYMEAILEADKKFAYAHEMQDYVIRSNNELLEARELIKELLD